MPDSCKLFGIEVAFVIISDTGIVDGRVLPNIDEDVDFRLQKAQGLERMGTLDQKCRSNLLNWSFSFISENDGRHGGIEPMRSVVRKLEKWWVCTTIKQDSHCISERINVGLGFLQDTNEHAGDDDGSVGR